MAQRNDFIPNKLSFRVNNCLSLIEQIYNLYLDDLSQHLINIVMGEIWLNGNGSTIMKLTACAAVRETKREITAKHICLEVGVDPELIKGEGEAIFVRVSVVLHGNQAGGILKSKPGQLTWNKHIIAKQMSTAKDEFELPDKFNQDDAMPDILKDIENNIDDQLGKYIEVFASNISKATSNINWSAFIDVG